MVIVIGTAGYKLLGGDEISLLDSLFMTVITISTVGYREIIDHNTNPATAVFTMILIFVGLGILLYTLGTVTAFLVEGEVNQIFRRRRMHDRISKLKGHTIICGAGRSGGPLIARMCAEHLPFVVIEKNGERIERLMQEGLEFLYLIGDATDDLLLEEAGIEKAAGLITVLSNDQDGLYIALSARALNPKLRIITRASDDHAFRKMLKAGADNVVSPNTIGAELMFSEMVKPAVTSFIRELTSDPNIPFILGEYQVSDQSKLAGRKLADLKLREKSGIQVVAIRDAADGKYTYNPSPSAEIVAHSTLILIGERDKLSQIESLV